MSGDVSNGAPLSRPVYLSPRPTPLGDLGACLFFCKEIDASNGRRKEYMYNGIYTVQVFEESQ